MSLGADEQGSDAGAPPARRWDLGVTGAAVGLVLVALVVTGLAARGTPTGTVDDFVVAAPPPVALVAVGPGAPGSVVGQAGEAVVGQAGEATGAPDEVPAATGDAATGNEQPTPVSRDVPLLDSTRADPAWVSRISSATGIPARALQAYGDAVLTIDAEDPGCRLGWPTLAGIGRIESGHGRAGLADDGHPAAPIVGPALDGGTGRAAIRATPESTAWHGDPLWDHAVGPMQFIPSTWRTWAADGDRDGVADPQDIDDASLAAARYLCAGARDLSTADGWTAAVLSYNHSDAYVASVFSAANAYAAAVG